MTGDPNLRILLEFVPLGILVGAFVLFESIRILIEKVKSIPIRLFCEKKG